MSWELQKGPRVFTTSESASQNAYMSKSDLTFSGRTEVAKYQCILKAKGPNMLK